MLSPISIFRFEFQILPYQTHSLRVQVHLGQMLSSLYLSWKPNPHDDLASVLFRENGVIVGFAESSGRESWGHCRVSPWPAFPHSCQVRAPPVSLFSLCPLFRKPITGVRKPLQSAEHRENHPEGEKRCGARRKPLSSRSNTRVLCSLPGQGFAVISPPNLV